MHTKDGPVTVFLFPESDGMPTRPFLYGAFEDGNLRATLSKFAELVAELVAAGMNAVAFTNNLILNHDYLDAADEAGISVVGAQMTPLNAWIKDDDIPATIENARSVVYPIAPYLSSHPSLMAYNMFDDAIDSYNLKLLLTKQAYAEIDPNHPAIPMLVMQRQALQVSQYVEPDIFISYYNYLHPQTPECDMFDAPLNKFYWNKVDESLQWFAQERRGFVQALVLQSHSTLTSPNDTTPTHLREPTPLEIMLLVWIALGLEFCWLFWFLWSTSQTWRGLPDQPENFAAAKAMAVKFFALAPTLENAERIPDRFRVSGSSHFISTFRSLDGSHLYCVVARCSPTSGTVTVLSDWYDGTLRDLLTGDTYDLGDPIPFGGGDGRMFVLDSASAKTEPALAMNHIGNGGFEALTAGYPTGWTSSIGVVDTDVYHAEGGGTQSLRFDGPCDITFQYNFSGLQTETDYYFTYWRRFENLDGSMIGATVYQSSPTITDAALTVANWRQSGTSDWMKGNGWFRTPAGHSTGRAQFFVNIPEGASAWFDDVGLYERWGYAIPDEYLGDRLASAPAPTPPSIVQNPQNRTITSGSRAQLSVAADGTPPLNYQWYEGDSGTTDNPIAGATGSSYTTDALTETTRFWVRVSSDAGEADSATATVTVTEATETRYVFLITS
jgi:hypothetical protein